MKLCSQLDEVKSIKAEHSGPIVMGADFNTCNETRLGLVFGLAIALTPSLPGLLWKSTKPKQEFHPSDSPASPPDILPVSPIRMTDWRIVRKVPATKRSVS